MEKRLCRSLDVVVVVVVVVVFVLAPLSFLSISFICKPILGTRTCEGNSVTSRSELTRDVLM